MCPGLLETRFYAAAGVPAYAYGPGLLSVSHGPTEFVRISRMVECAKIYALVAVASAGTRLMDFSQQVRLAIYQMTVTGGRVPSFEELAAARGLQTDQVRSAYRTLADAHVIVLEPGSMDVWSAPPFSAVPTPFRVHVAPEESTQAVVRSVVRALCLGRVRHSRGPEAGRDHRCELFGIGPAPAGRRSGRAGRRLGNHPPRSSGQTLLGRHLLYVSQHPALPVGRGHHALVRQATRPTWRDHDDRSGVGLVEEMVRHAARCRLSTADDR